MTEPAGDDEENPELDAAIGRLKEARLRFQGLPTETPMQILDDTWERLLLTPAFQKYEEQGVAAADTGFGFVLTALGVPAGALAVKGADFVFHMILHALENKAKRDQDAEGWKPNL